MVCHRRGKGPVNLEREFAPLALLSHLETQTESATLDDLTSIAPPLLKEPTPSLIYSVPLSSPLGSMPIPSSFNEISTIFSWRNHTNSSQSHFSPNEVN
ncbi:hypothetical protein J1N35_028938 [Gossypium stocksii]|uniref:Uncharacterized protein n=1 Tax=Gossypium stocksii TaxID=47602 RepID=A0A9D3ZRL0_9ROSI|nr:hypothetical protein J1N35_028938 [Gossypium stocksii]